MPDEQLSQCRGQLLTINPSFYTHTHAPRHAYSCAYTHVHAQTCTHMHTQEYTCTLPIGFASLENPDGHIRDGPRPRVMATLGLTCWPVALPGWSHLLLSPSQFCPTGVSSHRLSAEEALARLPPPQLPPPDPHARAVPWRSEEQPPGGGRASGESGNYSRGPWNAFENHPPSRDPGVVSTRMILTTANSTSSVSPSRWHNDKAQAPL